MYDVNAYLTIPVYSSVKLFLTSMDVIHSFGVNSLGIKMDVIPGTVNTAYIHALLQGEFNGYCYELCGQAHTSMLILTCVL